MVPQSFWVHAGNPFRLRLRAGHSRTGWLRGHRSFLLWNDCPCVLRASPVLKKDGALPYSSPSHLPRGGVFPAQEQGLQVFLRQDMLMC